MATPRPAQRSISMSLRPSPIASTSAASTPSSAATSASAGRLGDAHRARGRARRSSRRRSRCRAARACAASATKSSAVASGSRMITRLTGSATRSSTLGEHHLAGELAVGERPVDAGSRRRAPRPRPAACGCVLEQHRARPARRRRSPRGRPRAAGSGRSPRRCWPPTQSALGAVGAAGRAGRRSGSCRAASGRWPARRGRRRRSARCTASYTGGLICSYVVPDALDPLRAGCRRCRGRPAAGASRSPASVTGAHAAASDARARRR